jgi:polysaccharide pyruvyl transferase WcaK-like protein
MRIIHSYCLNYNFGDYALGIGVKNLLRHFLPIELIGQTNLQGREFNEYYISNVINKLYNFLVIGGGGIIHGAHWPQGWFWLVEKNDIIKIKIPFIVYGVGYNYFHGEGDIPERGIDHLKETSKHAIFFSVRNDGSRERLHEKTGILAEEVPDPGFYVGLNREYERPIAEDYCVVQLANDKFDMRYKKSQNGFINQMRRIVKSIAKKHRVILIPHVIHDVSLCLSVAENINGVSVIDFGAFAFDHIDPIIAYYKYAKYVFAMRGHAQIIPIGFNVPVISLESHPKNRGLTTKLGLLEWSLSISNPRLADESIYLINEIDKQSAILINYYKTINMQMWEKTSEAWKTIQSKISISKGDNCKNPSGNRPVN